jgi:outer membrane lipoprotein-sorting protein
MKTFGTLLLATVLLWPLQVQSAQDAVAKGETIAREAERRDAGFGDTSTRMTMILTDRKGNTRERILRISTLEVPNPKLGDKSLVIFDAPRDLKGTAFLSHARILEDDDQWLFLPAIKRIKRISSSNKTGSFFGSEFAYEDITALEYGKYAYKWLENQPCGRLTCYVVERKPLYKNSGYSRLLTWYDTSEYRIWRVDYYDRKGKQVKSLSLSKFKKYLGKFWRAQQLTMKNLKTGRSTTLIYDTFRFRTGLKEAYFSKANLKNVR